MSTTPTPSPSHAGRTAALIVVGVLITAMLAWLAVAFVRTLTRPDASGTFEISERFDAVVLDGDLADVSVAYGDVESGELTLRQNDSRARLALDHEVRGDTLHVSLRHVREFGIPDLWWPWMGDRAPELQLVLPAALEREPVALDLRTDVGDVDAVGTFDDVSARSHVGDIVLVGSAASLDVTSDVGTIDLARFDTEGELTVQSAVGDVTLALESLPSGIRVETDLGEVDVNLPQGRYAITVDSALGEVDVQADSDMSASRQYRFETNIGNISVTS
ncbi:DUF4097 family beta strand repeat-containing protein [Agromyces sp. Marseille-P2726]|uniref:DUF4097 family beta strand repeat-containing protein n=1 Tax=Agromyces sp. Marseille-P2726 TaxID=2709132 RepID=UPI00156D4621|nr:DUF4097 family beta strand repeat-containing protein [Agromyces sp. Marseille-P2726]